MKFDFGLQALNERIKELEKENARLKEENAFFKKAIDAAVVDRNFFMEKNNYKGMCEENLRLREALEFCARYLVGGIMTTSTHVKQLDGTVKLERVPTYRAKVWEKARAALATRQVTKVDGSCPPDCECFDCDVARAALGKGEKG